jgi:hypothetical protein
MECGERQERPAQRCVHIFPKRFNRFFLLGGEFFDGGDMRSRYGRIEKCPDLEGRHCRAERRQRNEEGRDQPM